MPNCTLLGPLPRSPQLQQGFLEQALNLTRLELGALSGSVDAMQLGQFNAWREFVQAVSHRQSVHLRDRRLYRARVVALGGSMLGGAECDDGVHKPWSATCAYPRRFVSALEQIHRKDQAAQIDFVNLAMGGTTSISVLPSLPVMITSVVEMDQELDLPLPTLVIIDYSVNDALEVDINFGKRQSLEAGSSLLKPAIETMVRYLLSGFPSMALLLMESYHNSKQPSPASRALRAVTKWYGVPLLRYADVVQDADLAWSMGCRHGECAAHPRWQVHQLVADTLLYSYAALTHELCTASAHQPSRWNASLPPTLSEALDLRRVAMCVRPSSHYSGAGHSSSAILSPGPPRVAFGNWSLYEDRPGKAGWITTGPKGSRVDFEVVFGAVPLLVIAYVRGYTEEWGTVQVRLSKVRRRGSLLPEPTPRFKWNSNKCNLHARRDDDTRVTQTAVAVFDAGQPYMQNHATMRSLPASFNGILGFGVPPHSTATLSVTLVSCPGGVANAMDSGCKFKVTTVTAC